MKRARILRRGPRLFVHAVSRAADGTWVLASPLVVAALSESDAFLGEAIATALLASRSGARDATESMRMQILEKARTKKWSTFLAGTACCDVEKDETGVRFFPARAAYGRPFAPQTAPAFVLPPTAHTEELGAALKAALRSLEPRRRSATRRPR